jgi:endonuclease/exonuclease/phosphatase family metal-dependent hydrolase
MLRLRVVVWNVHGFRAGPRRLARAMADLRPDLILLNEIRFRWRIRRFARLLGMDVHHGLSLSGPVLNAVLVRPPWRIVERWAARLSRTPGLNRRGVVAARVGRAGSRLTVAAVHLGVSDGERVAHAEELTDMLAGAPPPLIVGGDLNESPEAPAVAWIAERYFDAFSRAGTGPGETFPAGRPRARIDYLFVTDDIRVAEVRVGDDPEMLEASDHRPVIADLELDGGQA